MYFSWVFGDMPEHHICCSELWLMLLYSKPVLWKEKVYCVIVQGVLLAAVETQKMESMFFSLKRGNELFMPEDQMLPVRGLTVQDAGWEEMKPKFTISKTATKGYFSSHSTKSQRTGFGFNSFLVCCLIGLGRIEWIHKHTGTRFHSL